MNVGGLVKHWNMGMGVVLSLTEPTVRNPYQLATVCFNGERVEELVTTSLTLLSKKVDK